MTVGVVDWLGKSLEIHPATSFNESLLKSLAERYRRLDLFSGHQARHGV